MFASQNATAAMWLVTGVTVAHSSHRRFIKDAQMNPDYTLIFMEAGKRSWSFRRMLGKTLKGFARGVKTAVRREQVGEGLLAGVPAYQHAARDERRSPC